MPEPLNGPPPPFVPSGNAVVAAAQTLVAQAGPFTELDNLPALEQYAWKKVALDMLNAAGPELVASVISHVAENPDAYGLDALDRLFDFGALASNVRATLPANS